MSAFGRLCSLEARRLWRAPATRWTVLVLLFLEATALTLGILLSGVHRDLAARDVATSRARIEALSKGEGQASALELAIFQDTAIARGSIVGSAWVTADLAALPDTAVVRIHEPALNVPAVAERSPAAAVLGTYDLAWFWALLLPLAAIILGYEAIARDRERGLLAMLLSAQGGAGRLVVARALALFLVLAASVLPPLPIAVVLAANVLDAPLEPLAAVALVVLAASYLAFISAAVIAASSWAERSASALAALLFGYLTTALVIPLLVAGLVRFATPEPDPRARLIGEQAAAEVFTRPSPAVIATELERHPSLAPDRGVDGATSQNRTYLLLAAERLRRARGARYADERRTEQQADLTAWSKWLSPMTMLTGALAELGGTASGERVELAVRAEAYRVELERFVTERVVANQGALPDPEMWPKFERAPEPNLMVVAAAIASLLLLAGLLVGMGILGVGSPATK